MTESASGSTPRHMHWNACSTGQKQGHWEPSCLRQEKTETQVFLIDWVTIGQVPI